MSAKPCVAVYLFLYRWKASKFHFLLRSVRRVSTDQMAVVMNEIHAPQVVVCFFYCLLKPEKLTLEKYTIHSHLMTSGCALITFLKPATCLHETLFPVRSKTDASFKANWPPGSAASQQNIGLSVWFNRLQNLFSNTWTWTSVCSDCWFLSKPPQLFPKAKLLQSCTSGRISSMPLCSDTPNSNEFKWNPAAAW